MRTEALNMTIQDQFGTLGSAEKIRRELGWEPKVCLEEGLKAMVDWAKVDTGIGEACK